MAELQLADQRFITMPQAAVELGVHVNTIRIMVSLGTFQEFRFGPRNGAIRLERREFEAYVNSRKVRKARQIRR